MVGGAIDIRVEQGFLKITCEIAIKSSEEEYEDLIANLHFKLLGSKGLPGKFPSFAEPTVKALNEKEAAVYIGRSISFLRKCRQVKYAGIPHYRGPKYIITGKKRGLQYLKPDLDEWMNSHEKRTSN